jgi:hypothetical protein
MPRKLAMQGKQLSRFGMWLTTLNDILGGDRVTPSLRGAPHYTPFGGRSWREKH